MAEERKSPSRSGVDVGKISARLEGMKLTEKEASGIVIEGLKADLEANPKWAAVGLVLAERQVNAAALEKCLTKAWGLRKPASFRHLGGNPFVVQFGSEGDWNRAMENGPWQFDFHGIVLKKLEGKMRPSEVKFSSLPLWVHFLDLPPAMMNKKYGQILGG